MSVPWHKKTWGICTSKTPYVPQCNKVQTKSNLIKVNNKIMPKKGAQ